MDPIKHLPHSLYAKCEATQEYVSTEYLDRNGRSLHDGSQCIYGCSNDDKQLLSCEFNCTFWWYFLWSCNTGMLWTTVLWHQNTFQLAVKCCLAHSELNSGTLTQWHQSPPAQTRRPSYREHYQALDKNPVRNMYYTYILTQNKFEHIFQRLGLWLLWALAFFFF